MREQLEKIAALMNTVPGSLRKVQWHGPGAVSLLRCAGGIECAWLSKYSDGGVKAVTCLDLVVDDVEFNALDSRPATPEEIALYEKNKITYAPGVMADLPIIQ